MKSYVGLVLWAVICLMLLIGIGILLYQFFKKK